MGEGVFLLEAAPTIPLSKIHETTALIEASLKEHLIDIVPAYHSITLFTSLSLAQATEKLQSVDTGSKQTQPAPQTHEVPICYELGLDWPAVTEGTQLPKEEIIRIHLAGTYQNIFLGFTPGFIYAAGLDQRLACPRKKSPRTQIAAGSVGIGGNQTGIYSLRGPGGWQIIGQTPLTLFDLQRAAPMQIAVGDLFRFKRIDKSTFDLWGS